VADCYGALVIAFVQCEATLNSVWTGEFGTQIGRNMEATLNTMYRSLKTAIERSIVPMVQLEDALE
jgi:hypothetical protein